MWGIGAKFQIKENEAWVDIARVRSITPPGLTTDMADGTHLQSEGGVEEKQPTIHRLGDAVLNVLFEPDDEAQKELLNKQINRKKLDCRIVFPGETNNYNFSAYISGFELGEITPEGLLEATITFSASAKPAFGNADQG